MIEVAPARYFHSAQWQLGNGQRPSEGRLSYAWMRVEGEGRAREARSRLPRCAQGAASATEAATCAVPSRTQSVRSRYSRTKARRCAEPALRRGQAGAEHSGAASLQARSARSGPAAAAMKRAEIERVSTQSVRACVREGGYRSARRHAASAARARARAPVLTTRVPAALPPPYLRSWLAWSERSRAAAAAGERGRGGSAPSSHSSAWARAG